MVLKPTKEDLLEYHNTVIPIPQDIKEVVSTIFDFDSDNEELVLAFANATYALHCETDAEALVQTAILQRCALSIANRDG